MQYVDPEIFTVWAERLAADAAGLDLSDADDRATFRGRVHTATASTTCVLVVALAREAGHRGPVHSSRAAAVRALADAWIARDLVTRDTTPMSCE